jgi:hypothetical protein
MPLEEVDKKIAAARAEARREGLKLGYRVALKKMEQEQEPEAGESEPEERPRTLEPPEPRHIPAAAFFHDLSYVRPDVDEEPEPLFGGPPRDMKAEEENYRAARAGEFGKENLTTRETAYSTVPGASPPRSKPHTVRLVED